MGRRAQLPGTQLHARPDAARRPGAVLPLGLQGARRGRHRRDLLRPYPDPTQFDPDHRYYDPKSTRETPRWQQVDVRLAKKTAYLTLAQMRATPELEGMQVLARGNRLSITPVSPAHWRTVMRLIGEPA
nr:EVE domain-containing protein [Chitinimonas koreensis]